MIKNNYWLAVVLLLTILHFSSVSSLGEENAEQEQMSSLPRGASLVKADKVVNFYHGEVQYDLPTLSGEYIIMDVNYTVGGVREIQNVRLSLNESHREGLYTHYLMSTENQKIKISFIYKNGELNFVGVDPEQNLESYSKNNPFILTVVSKGGYEINFSFCVIAGILNIEIQPKHNPWEEVDSKPEWEIEFGKQQISSQEAQAAVKSNVLHPVRKEGKFGYINGLGKMVIEPKFDDAHPFSEGLAVIEVGEKYGYINEKGETVIAPQFDTATEFSGGLAMVESEWKVGYIEKEGQMAIKPQFGPSSSPFFEGFAAVLNDNNKWYFIDKTGKHVFGEYSYVRYFSEGLAAVGTEEGVGFIDKTGNIVIKPQFKQVSAFSEGLAFVQTKENKCGFINKTGNMVIDWESDCSLGGPLDMLSGIYFEFHEGLALMPNREGLGGLGYINKEGKVVVQSELIGEALPFSEGLASVQLTDSKWGFINEEGKVVIEPKFDYAEKFSGGLAAVGIQEDDDVAIGYIDKTGEYVWEPTK